MKKSIITIQKDCDVLLRKKQDLEAEIKALKQPLKREKIKCGWLGFRDEAAMKRFFTDYNDISSGNTTEDILRRFLVFKHKLFKSSSTKATQKERGDLVRQVMQLEAEVKITTQA